MNTYIFLLQVAVCGLYKKVSCRNSWKSVNRRVIPKSKQNTAPKNLESSGHTGLRVRWKKTKKHRLANENLSSIFVFFKVCIMPACSIRTIPTDAVVSMAVDISTSTKQIF